MCIGSYCRWLHLLVLVRHQVSSCESDNNKSCIIFRVFSTIMSSAWCFDWLQSFCVAGKQGQVSQILYTRRAALSHQVSAASSSSFAASSSRPQGSPDKGLPSGGLAELTLAPALSQAAVQAREFAAEIFRQFQGGGGGKEREFQKEDIEKNVERQREEGNLPEKGEEEGRSWLPHTSAARGCPNLPQRSGQVSSPASSSSSPSSPLALSSSQEAGPTEPGYVNYSRLHYRLQQPGAAEQNPGGAELLNRLFWRDKKKKNAKGLKSWRFCLNRFRRW